MLTIEDYRATLVAVLDRIAETPPEAMTALEERTALAPSDVDSWVETTKMAAALGYVSLKLALRIMAALDETHGWSPETLIAERSAVALIMAELSRRMITQPPPGS